MDAQGVTGPRKPILHQTIQENYSSYDVRRNRTFAQSFSQKLKMRSKIRGMIARYGMPAFWITINPSDLRNPLVIHLAVSLPMAMTIAGPIALSCYRAPPRRNTRRLVIPDSYRQPKYDEHDEGEMASEVPVTAV
jgi:hypothetical protein